MFSFFRLATPSRWIGLLLVVVGIRLPLWWWGIPLPYPHLLQQKAAEKLASGAMLYRDVWVSLPPFTALAAELAQWLVPNSINFQLLIGLLLICHQVWVVTRMGLSLDVFTERNFTPGLVYALVASTVPDFMLLSAPLLSLSFLMPAFSRIAKHLRVGVAEDEMFSTGLLLGCAALCHLPTTFLVLWLVFVYAFYSGATARHYMLMLLGVILPNVLVFLYWYWNQAADHYYHNYLSTLLGASEHLYLNSWQLLMFFLAPVLFWLLAALRIYTLNKFINYQNVIQTVMVLWLAVGTGVVVISFHGSPQEVLIILPPVAFMLTHYLHSFYRSFLSEVLFSLLAGALLGTLYIACYYPHWLAPNVPLGDIYATAPAKAPAYTLVKGKKVLILGHKHYAYLHNRAATPYLDTDLSYRHLKNLDSYSVVGAVYRNFSQDLPDLIIDQEHLTDSLFVRMPILAKEYMPGPDPGTWQRKNVDLVR